MKECPFCKSQVPDLDYLCPKCGKPFGVEQMAEVVAKAEPDAITRIETRHVPGHAGIAIVKIAGNCDDSLSKKLKEELATLRADNPEAVIFDLSDTRLIFSRALSLFIAFVREREDNRADSTAFINLQESIVHVIDSLGLGPMLPAYESMKDALAAVRGQKPD